MPKKSRNTKTKIVSAAWELFYKNGYDDTTVDDIVELSGTSKGSFYHYFESKDALLDYLIAHMPNPEGLPDADRRSQYDAWLSGLKRWKA